MAKTTRIPPDTSPTKVSRLSGPEGPLSSIESAPTVYGSDEGQVAAPPSWLDAEPTPDPASLSELTTQRLQKLEEHWTTRDIDPVTLRTDEGGTVRPDSESTLRAMGHAVARTVSELPKLTVGGPEAGAAEFVLGAPLGEGGMGVVHAATQRTLGREVAIKTVRSQGKHTKASPQLLLEARVTGTLEHPNVVPIYAIGQDEQGRPLIVMKRIEGTSWDALIAEMGEMDERRVDEHLQRHLGILIQVARAVHFAHSRGILHRDLKPANVMIGHFGEVYVVDWGVAVALNELAPPELPLAADVRTLTGTPAYMAPEMAAGDGPTLCERTDVYLLGATLHELITGRAPHEARTMLEMVRRAFVSEPHDFGPEVPSGLVRICHQAMRFDPAERFADAGVFATALEQFLHHRSSTALSDEATRRLERLQQVLEQVDESDHRQVRRLRTLFSEIRFAFTQARRSWSDNHAATRGLQTALELMIDFELRTGSAGAAATLLTELPEEHEDLAARVDHAVQQQRTAQQRLERLERDVDVNVGAWLRRLLAVALSAGWCACCVTVGVLRRDDIHQVSHLEFGLLCAVFGGLLGLTAFVGRRVLYANQASRRMAQTAVLVFVAYALLWPLAGHLQIAASSTTAATLLMGGALWSSLAVHHHHTWAGMAAGSFVALATTLLWPVYNFEIMGLGGVLGGLTTAALQRFGSAMNAAEDPPTSP